MREIKFRGWSPKEGMLQLDQITMGDCIWYCDGGRGVSLVYQKHIIVMQYTGIEDKNGNKIYEGDIIEVDWLDPRYKPSNHLVRWDNDNACFLFPGGCPKADARGYFTVIGNKFENPELLKKTNP